MQNLYNCIFFRHNENMNKTCRNEKMCKIYHDEVCSEYKEKKDERRNTNYDNGNTCSNHL